jgi:hypothetical protein
VIHAQASRSNPKQVWLLSLDSFSPDITETMLAECGLGNAVSEIHSMQWNGSKYVLLHLDRKGRTRLQQMKSTVDQLGQKFGVSGARLVVADETRMLKRIMDAIDAGDVKSWRRDAEGQQRKNKIGFLRRAVGKQGSGGVESSKRLKMLYLATKRKLDAVVMENDALRAENKQLRETRVIPLVSN